MNIPNYFNIIPVQDKKPLIAWKEYTERSQTANERLQFANSEQIGIVTGKVSRILVLDDDGGLDLEKYPVPKTWAAKTPRGGTHYYFRWTEELDQRVTTKVGVLPKVDVRGDGGYVVYYGFTRPYQTTLLVRPPQWLIDLLPKKGTQSTLNGVVGKLNSIKEGNRNASFASLAGGLRARGYEVDAIFELLKPKAKEVDFPESELRLVCQSIGRYPVNPNHADLEEDPTFSSLIENSTPVQWIVPGIIPVAGIGFAAGLPEALKTWILMDLALEFARGGTWLGKFPVNPCKVVYIDQERGKDETLRRFSALISAKGISASSLDTSLVVKYGMAFRLNLPQSCEKLERFLVKHRPDVVIVDSFKTFHTKNELVSADMQELMNKLKELREKFRCSFLFVHHEVKGVHQRRKEGAEVTYLDAAGTIDLAQTAEVFFNVVGRGDSESMLYHTKATGGRKFPPALIKITDVVPDKSQIKIEAY